MTTSNAGKHTILTAVLFLLPPLWVVYQKAKKAKRDEEERSNNLKSMAQLNSEQKLLRPPLPKTVQEILSKSRLAYLSTIDPEVQSSHLSLMRFTYLKDEEIIVLSTNMNTKKFRMLQKQRGIALLVHDFGGGSGNEVDNDNSGNYSITLNGECMIVEPGAEAERLRTAHLNHNPDYPQFIVGHDVAILCVHVVSARICNINDNVAKWNLTDESKPSE